MGSASAGRVNAGDVRCASRARHAEGIERTEQREIAQRLLLETDAPREFVKGDVRSRLLSFLHDRLRLGRSEPFHALEAKPHVVRATGATARDRVRAVDGMHRATIGALFDDGLLSREIHVDRQDRDAVPLRVPGDDCR